MQKILLVFSFVLLAFPAHAEVPKVVVSIAPLAGIAAAVMDGVGVPDLLITGNASPHTYALKPSDAQKLEEADLVLWVGSSFERFMAHSVTEANSMSLTDGDPDVQSEGKEIILHINRSEDEHHEVDDHDHDHSNGYYDPHLWLNPYNAVAIARQLAERLAALDPANTTRYQNNAHAFAQELAGYDADWNTLLRPHNAKPYIVFHDAYQYYEKHYGLSGAGAISLSPDVAPSAKRVAELRQRIKDNRVVCILAEPQFRSDIVDALIEGTGAHKGSVNPDASDLPITPHLYFDYMQRLTKGFVDCLKG